MKVRFTSGPKANTIEHLQPHVAQTLVAAGLAVEEKYASYAEFLSAANPPAVAPTVEWGVRQAGAYTPASVVKRTSAGELTHYRTPPPDCPPSIAAQFRELTDGAEVPLGPDETKLLEAAYRVGDSNKHRPVCIGKNQKGEPVYASEFLKRD
jgi:hypothetical protein